MRPLRFIVAVRRSREINAKLVTFIVKDVVFLARKS